ncbi:hypothetical protein PTKIN_Ptkin05aG0207900 [Pterospermum kingtungense]
MYAMLQLDMLQEENDNLLAKAYVHEYWSALALLPFEVVFSAGQNAKEEVWDRGSKHCLFEKCLNDCPPRAKRSALGPGFRRNPATNRPQSARVDTWILVGLGPPTQLI